MSIRTWLVSAAGAAALGFIGSSAQAAPIGSLNDVQSKAAQNSELQDVAWVRRCYWHRGHQHCRRYWDDSYGYYYDSNPGFSFFFDGGHRHRGHGHHHHGGRGHHGRGRH